MRSFLALGIAIILTIAVMVLGTLGLTPVVSDVRSEGEIPPAVRVVDRTQGWYLSSLASTEP